jgi:16S rRNA G1207 methylase RsmC
VIQTTTSEALAVASAGSTTTTYPDTDNQMEDGVFSFAKREDEVRGWNALLDRLGDTPQPGAALDVGCGLGAFVMPLRERFLEAFFIDRDAGRLQAAAHTVGQTPGV